MGTFRAVWRIIAFFSVTVGLYMIHALGRPFVFFNRTSARRWRDSIYRTWAKAFIAISDMRITVKGTPPEPPFFLVSNHLSYTDIPALRSVMECVFVAKADIDGWPVAGRIVRSFGTIFVERENRRDIPRAGEKMLRAIEDGDGVVVFPEGTSWNGTEVLPFKSSFLEFAAKAGLPVYYASISYKTPDGYAPAGEAVAWWREESTFGGHIFELFKLPYFEGFITFGDKAISASDRKQLAVRLRDKVAQDFAPMV
jgi:1-acyl-sn-glycerol-3-phosphate acyltransferase